MTEAQYEMDLSALLKSVKEEANPENEWVLYDDNYLKPIWGNWAEIVRNMSEVGAYPTVLFYERLEPAEDHSGESFNINVKDVCSIVKKTQQV